MQSLIAAAAPVASHMLPARERHRYELQRAARRAGRQNAAQPTRIKVRPAQVAPYLDAAAYQTIVFDGPFHAVKASKQRMYRDTLRRVVEAIYRGCVDLECDATIDECELDHDDPAVNGGPTSQENGRLRCPHSNRKKGGRPPPPADEE